MDHHQFQQLNNLHEANHVEKGYSFLILQETHQHTHQCYRTFFIIKKLHGKLSSINNITQKASYRYD